MNSVILTGRIAKDLELKYTSTQMAVVKFPLAVDRGKGKDGKRETDFPMITVFGKQAENVDRYCRKGSQVGVQGRIQTGSYQGKEGKTVYTTDVIADRIEFLGSNNKQDDGTNANANPQEEFAMLSEDVPF